MFRRVVGSALVLLMVMVFSPGRASAVTTGPPVLFSDGFEGDGGWLMPSGSDAQVSWTIVNSGLNPGASPHAGSGMADFNSYGFTSGSQARLYRAAGFEIPGSYAGVSLIFWMYHDTDYPGRNDQVQAQISTDGTTWTDVGSAVSRYDGTTGWALSRIDLPPSYMGQATVYLGFLGISDNGNDIYLDDVSVVDQGSGLIVPTATTLDATSVTVTGATLNGTANANYSLTTVTFDYGPTTSYGSSATAVPSPLTGGDSTSVSAVISGLIPDTPYHFRVTGGSSAGTTYGNDRIFRTTSGGTTLFSDGFEGSGWFTAQVQVSPIPDTVVGAWTIVNSYNYPIAPHSGFNLANFNSFYAAIGSQTRLYRDTGFAISGSYTGVILNFWIYHDLALTENDQVQAQISTDGTTWDNVGPAVSRYDGTTGWAQSSIDLTPYKGQAAVYLGFLGISDYGNDINLDDVSVVALTNCSTTVRVDATPYGSLQLAMNAAGDGSVISATAHVITEDLMFSQSGRVTFKGGYDCTFSQNPGYTTINGILRVSGTGTLVAEKLIIRR